MGFPYLTDSAEKPSRDGNTNLSQVAEEPYKVPEFSARTVVVNRLPLVERFTIDCVTLDQLH